MNPTDISAFDYQRSRVILDMVSAYERRRYNVTSTLIGWVHTQHDPCKDTADYYNTPKAAFKHIKAFEFDFERTTTLALAFFPWYAQQHLDISS